jgi:hypothetical protein
MTRRRRAGRRGGRLNFRAINRAALPHLGTLCLRWLPGGSQQGKAWRCGDLQGNPGRSCSVNLHTGYWSDYAAGIWGSDVISLAAAIHNLSQAEAARSIAEMLGLDLGDHHV